MQLHTLHTSEKGPVILWGMYEFRERELLNTYETIESLTGDCDYTLLAFEVMDWNREFSPWKSKEVDASFRGEAPHTLAVLRKTKNTPLKYPRNAGQISKKPLT